MRRYQAPMTRQTLLAYTYAAAGSALFSTKAIFIKLAYMDKPDAALMLALRMLTALPFFLAAAVYAVFKLRRDGLPLPPLGVWLAAALSGFIGYYLSALLDFTGLVYITAQLERLLLFTYPVIVMVLAWAFLGARITRWSILGSAITYAGLTIVFLKALPEGGHDTITGTALVLGCAFTFAVYQLLAKRYIIAMGSLLFTGVALSASAVASIAHYLIVSGGGHFEATTRFYWLAAGCGFFATVLPSFLINAGLSKVSAQATSMISSISPVITIVLAVWILGETFTLTDAAGSALVIAGIALYALSEQTSTEPKTVGEKAAVGGEPA